MTLMYTFFLFSEGQKCKEPTLDRCLPCIRLPSLAVDIKDILYSDADDVLKAITSLKRFAFVTARMMKHLNLFYDPVNKKILSANGYSLGGIV